MLLELMARHICLNLIYEQYNITCQSFSFIMYSLVISYTCTNIISFCKIFGQFAYRGTYIINALDMKRLRVGGYKMAKADFAKKNTQLLRSETVDNSLSIYDYSLD